jgi:uncharacterized protein involved in exopolysaccharide biosynthesis
MSTQLGRDESMVHRRNEVKKEIYYLLIIPIVMVVSLGVASLFLNAQRPIYSAQAILECAISTGVPLYVPRPNVMSDTTNTAIVIQACNLMSKSPDSVTSHLIRTSSRLAKTSRIIHLVTEAHDPQLASDYVNALAKALCLKHSDSENCRGQLLRLVEPAYTPEVPDSPQWTKTLLLAAAGGFVAGLAFYLFGYALRRKTT